MTHCLIISRSAFMSEDLGCVRAAHRVKEQLIPVLASDGDQPVTCVSAKHDADLGLAVLSGPAQGTDALQKL
jgi:hypothetical protein